MEHQDPYQHVIVKNTFFEVKQEYSTPRLQRSKSEGCFVTTDSAVSQSDTHAEQVAWPKHQVSLSGKVHVASAVSSDLVAAASSVVHAPKEAGSSSDWSIGSELHQHGRCSPCAWFHKKAGCRHGSSCAYCHTCPPGFVKQRRKALKQFLAQPAVARVPGLIDPPSAPQGLPDMNKFLHK